MLPVMSAGIPVETDGFRLNPPDFRESLSVVRSIHGRMDRSGHLCALNLPDFRASLAVTRRLSQKSGGNKENITKHRRKGEDAKEQIDYFGG